jgi:hypothetical protein
LPVSPPREGNELRLAAERLARFRRLGGVDIDGLEGDDRAAAFAEVQIGLAHLKHETFLYVCPTCGNKYENDQEMEPVCTGPFWTHDHPLELMRRMPG